VFQKRNPPIGSRPGTLAIPEGAPRPQIDLVQYDATTCRQQRIEHPDDLAAFLDFDGVTWINVVGVGDEAVLWRMAEIFDIQALALEDAVNAPQRAKTELFAAHQQLIARVPIEEDGGCTGVPQICAFIGRRYLLTFQERPFGFFDPVRKRIQAGIGPIRGAGPDYLAYALLDTLVDRYYPIAERLAAELEDIEDEILQDPEPEALGRIHRVRRELVILRRVGGPQREAISAMIRVESPFIGDGVRGYLRDTDDHMSQIMEVVDSSREMAVGLTEIYISNVSHRTNEIMKLLTLMASIFIPLTFIAGVYGMNFEFMPELHHRLAYPVVLASMTCVAILMIAYFGRRGWIRLPRRRRRPRDRK
jgi:magnesium transporter